MDVPPVSEYGDCKAFAAMIELGSTSPNLQATL